MTIETHDSDSFSARLVPVRLSPPRPGTARCGLKRGRRQTEPQDARKHSHVHAPPKDLFVRWRCASREAISRADRSMKVRFGNVGELAQEAKNASNSCAVSSGSSSAR